jgi:pimeloyl-ACP methyl ester carboxylesterase
MDDVLAVLDAAGSQQASIFGVSEGGALAALFAATHPARTARIILYGTPAHYHADARYPAGAGDGTLASFAEAVSLGWGMRSDWAVQLWAPSMVGDEPFTEWLAKYARQSVSRGAILPLLSAIYAHDLAVVFPAVRVPTWCSTAVTTAWSRCARDATSRPRSSTPSSSSWRGSTISRSSATPTPSWPRCRTFSSGRGPRSPDGAGW